ncbi:MAG: hypothetical protein ACOX6I_02765 [Syntrophomonadaceae bacterium]|jgi:hypothetical protein
MNKMDILSRLVSIKSNANGKAYTGARSNRSIDCYKIKASSLESGINQLIMELQNAILADFRVSDNFDPESSRD